MAVSRVALQVILDELMVENSLKMGEIFKRELMTIKCPLIKEVRGRGLFVGIEIKSNPQTHVNGNHLAKILKLHGLLTKATHDATIRLAPPLIINESQIYEAVEIVRKGCLDLEKMNDEYANKKH